MKVCSLALSSLLLAGSAMAAAPKGPVTTSPHAEHVSQKAEPKRVVKAAKPKDIVATLKADGHFKTLQKLMSKAGLEPVLQGEGSFTFFAPDDEAFQKVPKADLDDLMKHKIKLSSVLMNLMVRGALTADALKQGTVRTLADKPVMVTRESNNGHDDVIFGKAKIKLADMSAKNGIIHVVDTFTIP